MTSEGNDMHVESGGKGAATAEWTSFADDEGRFTFEHPLGWTVVKGYLGSEVAIVDVPQPHGSDFATNFNIVLVELEAEPPDPEAFFEGQLTELGRSLTDPLLIEVDDEEVAGRAGNHVLVSHRHAQYALTLEQWYVLDGTRSWVVSATTTSHAYSRTQDLFQHMAETFSLSD